MAEPALPVPTNAATAPVAWRPFVLMAVAVVAGATALTLAVVHVATPGVPRTTDAVAPAPTAVAPVATTAPAQAPPSGPAPSAVATTRAASPVRRAPVYVVYEGQTLSELAARFHTTVPALVALNHITDPDLIYPGQRIRVS